MVKEKKEKYFKQQFPQLQGIIYRLHMKYPDLEKDEIQSRVYLRFCFIIDEYDKDISSIYTYLMNQLRCVYNELKVVNKKEKKLKGISIDSLDFDFLGSRDKFIKVIELYDKIKKELSNKSRMILEYILKEVGKETSYDFVQKHFCKSKGWKKIEFDRKWKEIKLWWNSNNFY